MIGRWTKIITFIKDILWGAPTLILLLVLGIYFTYKSGFYRPSAIKKTFCHTIGSLKPQKGKGISSFGAVATALGGTVGVGSIVGIGYGIAVGGAGSVFWMWVCSFFGMGLKYAEVRIALNNRSLCNGELLGGAPVRLRQLGYKKTAVLFCLFCILASFGTGNLTQIGAVSDLFGGCNKTSVGLFCVVLVGIAVFGGRKRIADINTILVPAASFIYLSACFVILIINRESILPAFRGIFSEAFGFSAVTGGFSGALIAHTLREGFARSLFSNEAGMGSSPLAHATAQVENIDVQAEWGIFEVFFDIFIVSTLTALCILTSGGNSPENIFGLLFGEVGRLVFSLLSVVFVFASVISWCYYSECCISCLFPKSKTARVIYRVLFSLTAFFGVNISRNIIWELADILNALMMFPNLFLLFKCRKEIERI